MRRHRLLLPALVAAIWLAYLPVWRAGFIWDDNAHVTRPELRSLQGLGRIWCDLHATQQYYPLLHSAFWVEHRLFGDSALPYHLINVALHSLNAVLVLLILRRLRVPGAMFAAALFALHPVMVESVAWVSELKNTLSSAFYLGAALVYLRFDEDRSWRAYVLALGLFCLGLLSKTVTATLPAALLVIFWWQRGKIEGKRDVRPLLPFFALGLAGGLLTAWIERRVLGAEGADFALTFVERGLVAGRVCWFYLGKLLWPVDLLFTYPRWTVSQQEFSQYAYPAAALLVLAACWQLRQRSRAPLAGALFFIGTLFPALGFFNVYPFLFSFVADHFQYLASLGVIVPLAAGAASLLDRRPEYAAAGRGLAVGALALLGALTWQQALGYLDNQTIFTRVLEKNRDSWLAHFNLGNEDMHAGRFDSAVGHFQSVLRTKPASAEAYADLSGALAAAGHFAEAAVAGEESVRLKPSYAAGRNYLGTALLQLGRFASAAEQFQESIRLQPNDPVVHADLALALRRAGRKDEAIVEYQATLRLAPADVGLLNALGTALLETGRVPEAIADFEAALRLQPNDPLSHYNLGNTFVQAGRLSDAITHYTAAVQSRPAYAEALNNLAGALAQSGRMAEAADRYRAALNLQPGDAEMHTNLGAVLANQGAFDAARRQFEEALRLQPNYQPARDNLEQMRGLPEIRR